MGVDGVLGVGLRLNASVEGLAALVAYLRVRAEGLDPGPEIRSLLVRVVGCLGVDAADLDELTTEEAQTVVGAVRTFFRQAEDLMADPDRPPGWGYDDPLLLQSQGRTSALVSPLLAGVAPSVGDLDARLHRARARFLDVGTGVGLLAVSLCRTFPNLDVVGIDVWQPALELAEDNVRDAGLAGRIELRNQSIVDLDERSSFDAAWIPGPFLPRGVFEDALERTTSALVDGGWIVVGLYGTPDDPLSATLNDLRVVRSGGHPWTADQVVDRMHAAGLTCVQAVERTWSAPIAFVVGRRNAP